MLSDDEMRSEGETSQCGQKRHVKKKMPPTSVCVCVTHSVNSYNNSDVSQTSKSCRVNTNAS